MSMLKSDIYVKCQVSNAYVDPWDILNNFCFYVYDQNWRICEMSSVKCEMSNAYVHPWDMLNNFCFHVYTQKSHTHSEVSMRFYVTSLELQAQEIILSPALI